MAHYNPLLVSHPQRRRNLSFWGPIGALGLGLCSLSFSSLHPASIRRAQRRGKHSGIVQPIFRWVCAIRTWQRPLNVFRKVTL